MVYGTFDGRQMFTARELTVSPGGSCTIKDSGAYGLVSTEGRGTIEKLEIDTPAYIRYGQVTRDEVFVADKKAKEGVTFKNTGTDPFVSLRYYGPRRPRRPAGGRRPPQGTLRARMMATETVEAKSVVDSGEQRFCLEDVSWEQYVQIDDALADLAGLRMIYIDGSLTPSTLPRRHDWFEDCLDKIVVVVALHCGIEQEVAGSATLRAEGEKVGLEGDRTYYFGPHAEIMRGPIDIDLSTQPPPDLAIEVEVTHPAEKAIATYARIGVPELWRYDAPRKTLTFLLLGAGGAYEPALRSRCLPALGPDDVLAQVRLAELKRPPFLGGSPSSTTGPARRSSPGWSRADRWTTGRRPSPTTCPRT